MIRLDDLFIALHSSTDGVSILEGVLTQADIAFAKKKVVSSYRCFADASKSTAYDQFLIHCENALGRDDEKPLREVVFNYLADTDHLLLNTVEISERLMPFMGSFLQYQQGVLAIAPMGRALIARPNVFAAFLRCLLLQGVTPEQILSVGLLQDFFRYYISALSEPGNPIEQLYALFEAFPETQALRMVAKTVCCEEGGLVSYALDGSQPAKTEPLHVIKPIMPSLGLTLNANNLKGLHALFGVDFLIAALRQWNVQSNPVPWRDALAHVFNQENTVKTQLPILLNQLQEQSVLQSLLAQILNDNTLAVLVSRRVGGVFHLIPFCPKIVGLIQAEDLEAYLQSLRQQASSGFELTACLMALFNGVKRHNEPAAMLVFDAVLGTLLDNPFVLDDASTIQTLRKFSRANECVHRRVQSLESTLNHIIQMQTKDTIEAMDYISIEDVWRRAALAMQHLRELVSFETTCPYDKYSLYTRLFRSFLEKGISVDLDAFTAALGIDPTFDSIQVTSYERLLFELLATIDEPTLRMQCIQRLDAHILRPWRTALYGDRCLFRQAVLAGNVGLIQWLHAEQVKSPDSHDAMAIAAAEANRWAVVHYFYQKKKLTRGTLNALLQHAVIHGSARTIQIFCSDDRHSPDLKSIEQTFQVAVRKQDIACTRAFLQSVIRPCDAVLAKTFKQAILLEDTQIAFAILEASDGVCLDEAVDQTLMSAARLNQWGVLNRLVLLPHFKPTQKAIDSALLQATRAQRLEAVQSLMLMSPSPTAVAIHRARSVAKKHPDSGIADYLSTSSLSCASPVKKRRSEQESACQILTLEIPEKSLIRRAASCGNVNVGHLLQRQGFFQSETVSESATPTPLKRQLG